MGRVNGLKEMKQKKIQFYNDKYHKWAVTHMHAQTPYKVKMQRDITYPREKLNMRWNKRELDGVVVEDDGFSFPKIQHAQSLGLGVERLEGKDGEEKTRRMRSFQPNEMKRE